MTYNFTDMFLYVQSSNDKITIMKNNSCRVTEMKQEPNTSIKCSTRLKRFSNH
jgi:hypothetical protein